MRNVLLVMASVWLLGLCHTGYGADMATTLELDGEVTVITSDRLTFDYEKQFALFEGNVVVTDPEMKLTAERMNVTFNKKSEVQAIDAVGDVRIQQEDKVANAGEASYNVKTGQITLKDNPRVRRGKDLLQGDVITFWRDENKMICEPRARLVIFPDTDNTRDKLFGE
ncbi:MAG: lipopolysaccharide transport periplasmic protein LptA [Spartobacteria bacterium]|nr:lipopolysaccharide transport periplasmic protein LptA [Spartobacteria bacterium]